MINNPLEWQEKVNKSNAPLNIRGAHNFWETVSSLLGKHINRDGSPDVSELVIWLSGNVGLMLSTETNSPFIHYEFVKVENKEKPTITPRGANLKVGDTVWIFDENRRIYEGKGMGSRIIYREHFRPLQIVGETSRSWVLRNDHKVSKKSLEGLYLSEYEIDLACWEHDYFSVIYRELQYAKHHTYEKLTAIAKILELDLPEVKE